MIEQRCLAVASNQVDKPSRLRALWVFLLVFGLVNGVLYSGLLPLWEGFDEPFHYGYVQFLSTQHKLPVLGKTELSQQIWRSLQLVPASHVVQHNMKMLTTYDQYFKLSTPQQSLLQRQLQTLDPQLQRSSADGHSNYEVHHAPLAYGLLAFPDWLLSDYPITVRVLWLRNI